ncbi:hypothetical protein SAMN05518855_1003228 [Paenibacillus sp. CF384]|nr:hypothetical protein SAMN05518855_1003228 [Paenibacillus sp. CF384]
MLQIMQHIYLKMDQIEKMLQIMQQTSLIRPHSDLFSLKSCILRNIMSAKASLSVEMLHNLQLYG